MGERRSWLPFLRDNHVGLLGQNAPNDSLPPSLSAASASADAVAGAGGGRGAAGAGGSTQNSGGVSEVFKCGECGECVCQCQDLLDSNPTTSSSVSRYPPVSHPHALSRHVILSLALRSCQCAGANSANSQDHRHDNAGAPMGVRARISKAVGAHFLSFDL